MHHFIIFFYFVLFLHFIFSLLEIELHYALQFALYMVILVSLSKLQVWWVSPINSLIFIFFNFSLHY
jgi:hypothetical protein